MRSSFRRGAVLATAILFAALTGCGGGGSSGGGGGPAPLDPDIYELNNSSGSCAAISLTPDPGGNSSSWGAPDLTLHNQFDDDYFCFNLQQDSVLIISEVSSFLGGDVDLQLLDSFGLVPLKTSSTEQDVELITYNAPADSYMVRVFSPSQDTNTYSLDVVAQFASAPPGVPDSLEPNDDPLDPTLCTSSPSNIGDLLLVSPYFAPSLSIHDTADVDYYCFFLTEVSTVDIEILFRDLVGNLDLELLDSSQSVLLSSTSVSDNEELRGVILPPDQFLIRVWGAPDPSTLIPDLNTYVLQVTATAGGGLGPDLWEPNDSPTDCLAPTVPSNFGDLTGVTIANPPPPTVGKLPLSLDNINDEDHFCFSLSQPATVTVTAEFVHADGNIDMQLLDSTQQVIFFAISFTDDERITTNVLAPGNYSIRVYGQAVVNGYELSLTVFDVDAIDLVSPNDDETTASLINPTDTISNLTIHDLADEDWFTVILPFGTDWDVRVDTLFKQWIGDLDLDLYDSQQNLITFSQSRDDNEQILGVLPPGTNFIRVYGFGGDLNYYDLNIVSTQVIAGVIDPDRHEINNSFNTAKNLNVQYGGVPYDSANDGDNRPLTVHNSADSDYFTFSMNGSGNHTLTVTAMHLASDGDLDIVLYSDPLGTPQVVARANTVFDNETLTAVVPAGGSNWYTVRIFGFNGDTHPSYHLVIDDTNGGGLSADRNEVNDTFATPDPQLTESGGGFPHSDLGLTIHNSIDWDWFSFTVNQPSSIDINLTFINLVGSPLQGDIDMALVDDSLNLISISESGTDNEQILANVSDGIQYRVAVFGFQGEMNTYDISMTLGSPIPPAKDGFEDNNSFADATRLSLPLSVPDLTIHDPATDDYYEVDFANPDILTVKISFTNALGDLDLEIFEDALPNPVSRALANSTANAEEIVLDVLPGKYFIRVYTDGPSANNYRLDGSTAAGGGGLTPDSYEFNDDLAACEPIVLNFFDRNLTIHNPIDEDFFCFDQNTGGKIRIELRFLHNLGDIDVALWCLQGGSGTNACDGRIVASSSSFTDNELINGPRDAGLSLVKGKYYIQVQAVGGDTNNYEMDVINQ